MKSTEKTGRDGSVGLQAGIVKRVSHSVPWGTGELRILVQMHRFDDFHGERITAENSGLSFQSDIVLIILRIVVEALEA